MIRVREGAGCGHSEDEDHALLVAYVYADKVHEVQSVYMQVLIALRLVERMCVRLGFMVRVSVAARNLVLSYGCGAICALACAHTRLTSNTNSNLTS